MEKVWRCTVCGYQHTGPQPPEFCPVCKVDASKFELVSGGELTVAEQTRGFLSEMWTTFVPHAVSAHFPNALLPTSVLFLLLYLVSRQTSFESTVFYLLVVVFLSIGPTYVTGILDWRKNYAGSPAPIFRKKLILGLLLFALGLVATAWRWQNPQVLTSGGFSACAYAILLLLMLGCVTLLGHYGGQLVFSAQGKALKNNQTGD